MAIPLELQLVITQMGAELFSKIQSGIAQTGAAAKDASTSGLKKLAKEADPLITKLGPDLGSAVGRTVSAMRLMQAEAGEVTPTALDALASSIGQVQAAYLSAIPTFKRLIGAGQGQRAVAEGLTDAEKKLVGTLGAVREGLLAEAAAMRESSAALAEQVAQQERAAAAHRDTMTATGEAISVMRTMEEEGTLTSQVLNGLANSLARTKAEMMKAATGYAELISLGLTENEIIERLSDTEARNISILSVWEKSIRAKSAALRESENALRAQQQAQARNSDQMMVLSSVTQGLMMGMGALQGNVMSVGFGLIFLRYAIAPIVLGVAALTAVLGGLVKIAKRVMQSITSLGNTLDEFAFTMSKVTEGAASAARMWDLTIGWAEKAARPIDEVSEALRSLADEELLRKDIIGAMFDYATAKGVSAAEAARLFGEAIGKTKPDIEALEELGVAYEDIANAGDRGAVIMAVLDAAMKQTKGSTEEWAATAEGRMERIRGAWAGIQSVFAKPIWYEILTPFVDLLAKAAVNIRGMAQEIWKSDAVQTEWNRTLKLGRDVMAWLTRAYKDNEELIRLFLEKALIGVLAVFRGILWVGKSLAKSVLMLAQVFGIFYRLLKPIRDVLGRVSQGLKELGFGPVLAAVKEFAFDFPGGLLGGILAAVAVLKGPGALSLVPLLANLISDILLELTNLDKESKEKWRNVFDWVTIGGIIGSFFGPVGMLIGAGLGGIVGLFLNFKAEVNAVIFDIGAQLGAFVMTVYDAVLRIEDVLDTLNIGMLSEGMEEGMRGGADALRELTDLYRRWNELGRPSLEEWQGTVNDLYRILGIAPGLGGGGGAGGVGSAGAAAMRDFTEGLAAELERTSAAWTGGMGLGGEAGGVGGVDAAAIWGSTGGGVGGRSGGVGAGMTVNINVTGNTVLNEDDARQLADKINRATMSGLTNRWGLQLARVG